MFELVAIFKTADKEVLDVNPSIKMLRKLEMVLLKHNVLDELLKQDIQLSAQKEDLFNDERIEEFRVSAHQNERVTEQISNEVVQQLKRDSQETRF